jgi:PAS domain S-box-containing protein
MPDQLRILIVDDSEEDAFLIVRQLKRDGCDPAWRRVCTAPDMRAALIEEQWDIVLCDYAMPAFSGVDALRLLREYDAELPLIVVSGNVGEETAVEIMKAGASDYVMKDRLMRLAPAVLREVRDAADRTERRRAEEDRDRLFELSPDPCSIIGYDGYFRQVNPAWINALGWTEDELLEQPWLDLVYPGDREASETMWKRLLQGAPVRNFAMRMMRPDGGMRWMAWNAAAVPRQSRIVCITRDVTEQQAAQTALRQSEERLRTLINIMPDIVCFKDGAGRWLVANDFDLELFGIAGVDYQGKKDSELAAHSPFCHDAFMVCEETDEQAWKAGGVSRCDEVIPRPDGDSWTFDVIKVPTFAEDGSRRGLVVVGRDITDRVRAEEALRQSEQHNRMLFQQSPIGLALCDMTGRFVDLNPAFAGIVGRSVEELLEMTFWDLTPEDHHERDREFLEILRRDGRTEPVEKEYFHADGHRVPVRISTLVVEEHGTEYIWASVEDVTAQRRAEDALRASEARFRTLVDNAPEAIVVYDLDLERLVIANENACTLFGHAREQLYQMGPADISPARQPDGRKSADLSRRLLRRALRGERPVFEWMHLDSAGREIPCEVRLVRLPDRDRRLIRGSITDITARKRFEQELITRAETERLLLSELDHRVRNNLTSLVALVDMSTEQQDGSASALAESIGSRIRTMATVHSLLSEGHWAPIELMALVGRVAGGDPRGQLRLEGPDVAIPPGQVQALAMVVNELLTNSRKHGALRTPDGVIEVNWNLQPLDGRRRIDLVWSERSGEGVDDPIPPDGRGGIGLSLIRGLVGSELRGEAVLRFPPGGAQHRLRLTLVDDRRESHTTRGRPVPVSPGGGDLDTGGR